MKQEPQGHATLWNSLATAMWGFRWCGHQTMGLVRYALDSATLVARESSYQQEHKDQHIFAVVQGLELKVEERLF
jgi:hypothetical protein